SPNERLNSGPPVRLNEPEALETVKRAVRKPAIAMLVMGYWSLIMSIIVVIALVATTSSTLSDHDRHFSIFAALLLVGMASVVIAAAHSMMKLRSFRLCVWGSIAVMPLGLFTFFLAVPVGIWSLMTLLSPESWSAFKLNEDSVFATR